MEQYDYHDEFDDMGVGTALLLIILMACMSIIDFFAKSPKWIYWTALVIAAMLAEHWFIHWGPAQAVAMGCTFIVAVAATSIPGLKLENENCKAPSVIKLWRRTSLFTFHTGLMFVFELLVVAAALFVHFYEASTVYWPGVITVLIVFPLLTYSIGYFSVQSYHRYARE